MSFAYSAFDGVITQSGTDAGLSGLAGLTGVTVSSFTSSAQTSDYLKIYAIDTSTQLVITGTLTIDPDLEVLVISKEPAATTSAPLYCTSTSVLNYGVARTSGSKTLYSKGAGLCLVNNAVNNFGSFGLYTLGTFNWNGGTIRSAAVVGIGDGATCTVNRGVFLNTNTVLDYQFRVMATTLANSNKVNISGLTYSGLSKPSRIFTVYSYGSISFTMENATIQPYNSSAQQPLTFINIDNAGNFAADFAFETNNTFTYKIATFKNITSRLTGSKNENTRQGYARVYRQYNAPVVDLNGSAVNYSYYGKDINNGSRTVGPQGEDDTADKVYSGTNQSGNMSFDVLLQILFTPTGTALFTDDDRTDANGQIPIRLIGYAEQIGEYAPDLLGLGSVTTAMVLLPDLSITESVKATVDAYTEIETPQKFYDRAKSYLFGNYSGQEETLASRNGDAIDAGSYNVTVDASAASAFAFDGTTITIKASVFTGNIITTGTITLFNGAVILGAETDSGGTIITRQCTIDGPANNSRVIVYDATTDTELYNAICASFPLQFYYQEGVDASAGDDIEIYHLWYNGVDGSTASQKGFVQTSATTNGINAYAAQLPCATYSAYYNTFGTIGAVVYSNNDYAYDGLQIDVDVDQGTETEYYLHRLFQWDKYALWFEGNREFFNKIRSPDPTKINISDLLVENIADPPTHLIQRDIIQLYRDDGTYPVRVLPGGSTMDIIWQTTVLQTSTGGIAPSEAQIKSWVRAELATEMARIDVATSTRATQASVDNIAIAGAVSTYAPTAAVRVIGDDEGGTFADLAAHDDTFMRTGEVVGTGLEVTVTRATSNIEEIPSACRVTGFYSGGPGHSVAIQVRNYSLSTWETKATMLTRTSAFDYLIPLSTDDQNPTTGEMSLRFVHSVSTYIEAHYLDLDWVSFEKVATNSQLGSDVAAIRSKTDVMQTFADTSESGQTYGKQFRDMRATLLGTTTGGGSLVETFNAADGTTPRVVSTNDGVNRTDVSTPGA